MRSVDRCQATPTEDYRDLRQEYSRASGPALYLSHLQGLDTATARDSGLGVSYDFRLRQSMTLSGLGLFFPEDNQTWPTGISTSLRT